MFCFISIILLLVMRCSFLLAKIMFIPYCYIGFVIGTLIICVMGGWYAYHMLIDKNYEGAEGVIWLTYFLGSPFTWLIVRINNFCVSIGIRIPEMVYMSMLCLLNWSIIGYALSFFVRPR